MSDSDSDLEIIETNPSKSNSNSTGNSLSQNSGNSKNGCPHCGNAARQCEMTVSAWKKRSDSILQLVRKHTEVSTVQKPQLRSIEIQCDLIGSPLSSSKNDPNVGDISLDESNDPKTPFFDHKTAESISIREVKDSDASKPTGKTSVTEGEGVDVEMTEASSSLGKNTTERQKDLSYPSQMLPDVSNGRLPKLCMSIFPDEQEYGKIHLQWDAESPAGTKLINDGGDADGVVQVDCYQLFTYDSDGSILSAGGGDEGGQIGWNKIRDVDAQQWPLPIVVKLNVTKFIAMRKKIYFGVRCKGTVEGEETSGALSEPQPIPF